MPKHSARRAFTLLELVIVLAILVTLSGLAVHMVGSLQDDNRDQETERRLDAIAQQPNAVHFPKSGCSFAGGCSAAGNGREYA